MNKRIKVTIRKPVGYTPVGYTIVSKPDYVNLRCPNCKNDIKVPFDKVTFNTDYWYDGAKVNCPECNKEIELDEYEYV